MSNPTDDTTAEDTPQTTTTNAEPGTGHPRLLFVQGIDADGSAPREFPLDADVTLIGSGPGSTLKLVGLRPLHAEIVHDDRDEYVLIVHGDAKLSAEPAIRPSGLILRSGARVELGGWAMSFQRDEFADHGRPYGGRQGGEFEHQQPQPPREQA